MGDRDGADVVKVLRAQGLKIPIIVISAHAYPSHRDAATEAGADDFIAKPFQIDDLLRKIRQHLQLQWIHPDKPVEITAPVAMQEPMVFPDVSELQELEQLAKIGDLRGLSERLQVLHADEPRYAAFVAHLQSLSKDFRLADIKRLLTRNMQ